MPIKPADILRFGTVPVPWFDMREVTSATLAKYFDRGPDYVLRQAKLGRFRGKGCTTQRGTVTYYRPGIIYHQNGWKPPRELLALMLRAALVKDWQRATEAFERDLDQVEKGGPVPQSPFPVDRIATEATPLASMMVAEA